MIKQAQLLLLQKHRGVSFWSVNLCFDGSSFQCRYRTDPVNEMTTVRSSSATQSASIRLLRLLLLLLLRGVDSVVVISVVSKSTDLNASCVASSICVSSYRTALSHRAHVPAAAETTAAMVTASAYAVPDTSWKRRERDVGDAE